jgi:hypothetical protein
MFYSNENAVGLKVVLAEDHWTEKGIYTRGHVMHIKRVERNFVVLEDDNGELTLPVNGFHLLEGEDPEEPDEAFRGSRGCHGTQACPGFQEDILALTHGTRRGRCRHAGKLFGGCLRSDYQEDMEAWRKCRKSNT